MSGATPPARGRRSGERDRSAAVRWLLRAALLLLVFALGIAIGEALHDNPKAGGTLTFERTLTVPTGPIGSTVTP